MADTAEKLDPLWVWGETADQPRVLHSMIRVRDVEAALRFYRDGLGMSLLDRYDFEQGRFSILFLSFGFNLLGDALRDTLDPRLRGQP